MNDISVDRPNSSYRQLLFKLVAARWGARIGITWIVLLVFIAVFAPLLANSQPLIVSESGRWSSPAVALMSASDFALIAGFVTACCAFFVTCSMRKKLISIVLVSLSVGGLGALVLTPPQLVVYEKHRENLQHMDYEFVLYAPIPYSPKDYLRDKGDTGLLAPLETEERTHWMGTEENGADVLSRMIHASRIALSIGFVATGIAMLIGVVIGSFMGFFSGVLDMLGMRLVEIFEAVPTLFLLLTFVAFFDRSLYIMMVIIGITSWPGYARYVRAEFLRLREQDFVQATIVSGLPLYSILFKHMLPNAIAPVLVAASFGIASAILAESTLSFLGLGLIDSPSWGQMLNQAVQSSTFYWWMALFPGGAIFLTVFAYNLIGDALRDAIDPRVGSSMFRESESQ